jgi:hypothetical protein
MDDSPQIERIMTIAAVVTLLAVPILETFRSLDLTDTGFILTNQRFIFTHPESVSYWFHLWLTNVVGGIIDLLFGSFGIIAHKIAGTFIFWGTMAAAFFLYKNRVKTSFILIALAASCSFNFIFKINIVHYDNLSALLYVVGAAIFASATLYRNSRTFLLAGFVLGLNVFARIPNVIGLVIVFVPCIIDLFHRGSDMKLRLGLREYAWFAAGVAGAVCAVLLAMLALGHLQLFVNSLKQLFSLSLFETRGHNIDRSAYHSFDLIRWPIKDTIYALFSGFAFALLLGALSAIVSPLGRRRILVAAVLVAMAVLVFFAMGPFMASLPRHTESKLQFLYRAVAGLCYWAVAWILVDPRFDRTLKLTAVISVFLSLALNIGSNTKIEVSTYVFPVMFPSLLVAAKTLGEIAKINDYRPLKALALCVIAVFAGISGFCLEHFVYRDTPSMRYMATNSQIRGVYTTKSRAKNLDELLSVLSTYTKAGDELFVCDGSNLINFAARTRPYLGTAWPSMYAPRYLDMRLRVAETHGVLPTVVRSRIVPRHKAWAPPPYSQTRDSMGSRDPINDFLDRNSYREVWRNSGYIIYVSQSAGPLYNPPLRKNGADSVILRTTVDNDDDDNDYS